MNKWINDWNSFFSDSNWGLTLFYIFFLNLWIRSFLSSCLSWDLYFIITYLGSFGWWSNSNCGVPYLILWCTVQFRYHLICFGEPHPNSTSYFNPLYQPTLTGYEQTDNGDRVARCYFNLKLNLDRFGPVVLKKHNVPILKEQNPPVRKRLDQRLIFPYKFWWVKEAQRCAFLTIWVRALIISWIGVLT